MEEQAKRLLEYFGCIDIGCIGQIGWNYLDSHMVTDLESLGFLAHYLAVSLCFGTVYSHFPEMPFCVLRILPDDSNKLAIIVWLRSRFETW